jgi:hypothetical protein
MAKFSSAAACMAVMLLTGINVGLAIDGARGDDGCATDPGAAAPKGQHWYYHMDRVKNRKCWYLHATAPLPGSAAAEPAAAHPDSVAPVATPQWPSAATTQGITNATSVAQSLANFSSPPSEAASTQAAPQVTVFDFKTISSPFVGTTSAPEAAIPDHMEEPPMPEISSGHANDSVEGNARPANGANLATVQAARDATHTASAPADTAVTASARTQSTHLPFLLLALALGIAAALIAFLSKITSLTRVPRFLEPPEDAWRSYGSTGQECDEAIMHQEDAPFLAPEKPSGAVDLDAAEWLEQTSPVRADFLAARPQGENPRQPEPVGLTQKDIQLALRILRRSAGELSRAGKGTGL